MAETAVNEDIPIVLGDLNSSTTPSENGKLHTFLDEIQMVSLQDKFLTTPPRTYWRGDDGISTIDHFLISPRFINHVIKTHLLTSRRMPLHSVLIDQLEIA